MSLRRDLELTADVLPESLENLTKHIGLQWLEAALRAPTKSNRFCRRPICWLDGSQPKFPTEISRGPRFEMQIKEQGAERARRTLVRRSERSDAVTQRCAQSGGSRPRGATPNECADKILSC